MITTKNAQIAFKTYSDEIDFLCSTIFINNVLICKDMQKYNSKITIDGSKLISSLFFVLQMGCIICCRANFFELAGWAICK